MELDMFQNTMADMTWEEVAQAASKHTPVLFPIGVIEEHGPHLTTASDVYYSMAVCRMIQEQMKEMGENVLIAPSYYWGINHCTGAFPGTFHLQPETMIQVLVEIFGNLHSFGLDEVYAVNFHGDALHVTTILKAIVRANEEYGMKIRMIGLEDELGRFGLTGEEDYLVITNAEYPEELFGEEEPEDRFLYDIHAGAFETAVLTTLYPDLKLHCDPKKLTSYSLTEEGLGKWLAGGETCREVVPYGYAGNPAAYERQVKIVKPLFDIMARSNAEKIIELSI